MSEQSMSVREEQQPVAIRDPQANALMQMLSDPDKINAIDVDKLDHLMQLAERMQDKQNEQLFNEAMNRAQSRMGRISADASNPQTRSRYASYAHLDSALRPIYTDEGFSLSFDTADAPHAEEIRVVCHVSHKCGFTRSYHVDMDASGKGAKGGDVMTKTHARGSGMTYGMRYLLKLIFNVAVGEDDDDGQAAGGAPKISDDQLKDLEALIEDVGANRAGFLKYAKQMFGADTLADIRAKDYDKAVAALEKKRKAA